MVSSQLNAILYQQGSRVLDRTGSEPRLVLCSQYLPIFTETKHELLTNWATTTIRPQELYKREHEKVYDRAISPNTLCLLQNTTHGTCKLYMCATTGCQDRIHQCSHTFPSRVRLYQTMYKGLYLSYRYMHPRSPWVCCPCPCLLHPLTQPTTGRTYSQNFKSDDIFSCHNSITIHYSGWLYSIYTVSGSEMT